MWDIELPLGQKYGLLAIEEKVNNAAGNYVAEVLNSLIAIGRIIRTTINDNPAYRSAMKSEIPVSPEEEKHIFSRNAGTFLNSL